MKFPVLLIMLVACVTATQDLSGKVFSFPQYSKTAHVRLNASKQNFSAVTVCHRSFTDLPRDHALFSLATEKSFNDFLIFYKSKTQQILPHVRHDLVAYEGLDYKRNTWHSICTTWDSGSELVQLWFNGLSLSKKFVSSGSNITGTPVIILGQEQDAHGGGFDTSQSFVGMITDVHMWDYILASCEIQKYMAESSFTPGNVLNWRALDFQITDLVVIENKQMTCQ